MLRQVDRSGLVSRGLVIDYDFVLVRQRIGDLCVEVSWIAFFAVSTGIGEDDSGSAFTLERHSPPKSLVETLQATMQGIRPIVFCQVVHNSVERKLCSPNSVGVATDNRSKIRLIVREIFVKTVKAEHNVV